MNPATIIPAIWKARTPEGQIVDIRFSLVNAVFLKMYDKHRAFICYGEVARETVIHCVENKRPILL